MVKQSTIRRYLDLLNEWKSHVDKGNLIEVKQLTAQRRMSQAFPTAAIKCGYFTRISPRYYKCNVAGFSPSDVVKIVEVLREDNKKSKYKLSKKDRQTPNELAEAYSIQELAEALKIKGCSAVIEIKETISF